jgi:hypothetical protein
MSPRVLLRRVLVTLGVVLIVVLATGAGQDTVPARGPQDAAASRAVAALTGPDRLAPRTPVDVAEALGHRPAAGADGPVDADGTCSSPVPLPAAFTDPCRAHDLGYDLLRAAAGRGAPLGPWARAAVDARFTRDLDAACDGPAAPPGCDVVGGAATAAVAVNSWRQGDGVPVVESPLPYLATAVGLVAVVWAWRRRAAAVVA